MRAKTCSKCGGRMAEGTAVIRDSNGSHCAGDWVEGPREKGFFSGVKTKGKRVLPLVAYRCERCSLVDFYADET